jgi:hypothetical protein
MLLHAPAVARRNDNLMTVFQELGRLNKYIPKYYVQSQASELVL